MNLLQLILFWAFVIFQVILAIYLVLPGALLIIKWLQPLGGRLFRKIYPAKTSAPGPKIHPPSGRLFAKTDLQESGNLYCGG